MKQIIYSALAIAGMFFFISCERHTWEDGADGSKGTKRLYPQPEKAHGDKSGKGHADGDHAKPAGDHAPAGENKKDDSSHAGHGH